MLLAPAELGASPPANGTVRPNFLVVVADDQCYRTINALNNQEVHTPNFDRMVNRGTTFTHCFHQGSWTGAICVASRAMLHTGRFVWKCGGNNCGNYPLLGETLQSAGYSTHIVGKWHNGDRTALRSFQTGQTIGPAMYESGPLAYHRPKAGDPWTPWDPQFGGQWTPHVWDIRRAQASPRYEVQEHSCELYADKAVQFLRNLPPQREKPFFLYVAWNAPHDPRQAPKSFVDRYPPDKIEVPANFLPDHPFDQGDNRVRDEILAPFPRTPEAVQLHRSEYYALVSYLDEQLGRILDSLDKSGQAGNTYIIITGDHGLAVGEHGLLGKQNLYDCSTRMPFIVAGPGIQQGRRIDALMYQHSIFPTLCDLAGAPIPAAVEFPSLLPLLQGNRERMFASVYCAYRGFQRMARTETHKLILYPEVKQVQLFDLAKDPWEINNLAGDPRHGATMTDLFRELKKWQGTVGDTLVLDPAVFGIKV
jgi:arylsulfatase A-like enzyme